MGTQQADEHRADALEHVVHQLGGQAQEFTPSRRDLPPRGPELPDRHPGENLPLHPASVTPSATVVMDCGTSRRSGYSHVLWISPSAEAILGSHGLDRLSAAIVKLPGVTAYEWEGLDLLHLRAAGSDWNTLLDGARDAVDTLLAAR